MKMKLLNVLGCFAVAMAFLVVFSPFTSNGEIEGSFGNGTDQGGSPNGHGCYTSSTLQCGTNFTAAGASVYVGNNASLQGVLEGMGGISGGFEASGSGSYVHYTAGGQQKICDFSGAYGYPFGCTTVTCSGGITMRTCVQKQ